MEYTRKKTRSQTNTYSKRASKGKFGTQDKFDLIADPFSVKTKQGEQQSKPRTRPKNNGKKATTGKQLPMINENEDDSSQEYSTFMIFRDEFNKRKSAKKKEKANSKPKSIKTKKSLRNVSKKKHCEEEQCDDLSEISDDLVVERIDKHKKIEIAGKLGPKKSLRRKCVQTTGAKLKANVDKDPERSPAIGRHDSIDVTASCGHGTSIENAREKSELFVSPLMMKPTSPVILKEEPDRELSEEDSVFCEEDFFGSSFSSEDNDGKLLIAQRTESSRYTYTYVSTYTQGTSTQCLAHSSKSPNVHMKKGSNMNSTKHADGDNLSKVQFPLSPITIHDSTNCSKSPYVPMKKLCSNMNSTKHPDKDNLSNLEFLLSPIYDRASTPSSKKAQNEVKKKPTRKEESIGRLEGATVYHPPKCSTMLYAPETNDGNFGFPPSFTGIEGMETIDPSTGTQLQNEDVPKSGQNAEIHQKAPGKLQDLTCNEMKDGCDENGNLEDCLVQKNKEVDAALGNEVRRKPCDDKVDSNNNKRQNLTMPTVADVHENPTSEVNTKTNNRKTGNRILKTLKRKGMRCVSNTECNSEKRYATLGDLQSPAEDCAVQPLEEEENNTRGICLSDPNICNNDNTFSVRSILDTWKKEKSRDYYDQTICCVNRFCNLKK